MAISREEWRRAVLNKPCESVKNTANLGGQGSQNSQLPAFFLVVALIALAYWLFVGFAWITGQRWDPAGVTIKGFRAGVTREQIDARLGPGSPLSDDRGWIWTPTRPTPKPGAPSPVITFEMLTLEKAENRWYLSGSQFEYGGQQFLTQFHCAEPTRQGTVQYHFGPGDTGTEVGRSFIHFLPASKQNYRLASTS